MREVVVDRTMLEICPETDGLVPCLSLYKTITEVTDRNKDVDLFDGLMWEGGLMKAMADVWLGTRATFTLTLNESTVTLS